MYTSISCPGFCGGRTISDVSGITSKQVNEIKRASDLYGTRPFVILNLRTQAQELKKFKEAGWKPHGAKFINKRTGNTVQMFSYTPVRNKRSMRSW